MISTTIAEFWEIFETLGKEKLQSAGISYQLISNLDDYYLEMKLQRNANDYILSFSTHHLDYNDGVGFIKQRMER
ncbi:hypothetical protein [Mucilaginibacter sp. KACC 22063]|uniref:hypothetical protein n=1 Tax=Mucilaginibacter sp. KACC 22063 TaxID=3025666 RepID=UPI0023672A64|nr:hypothetical protein [Mucilaginibacter sp. KACC 22063]WDF55583.1 hypothetical protein PQ461_00740 [Mucilaginibacter sp. KACC 22063]